VSLKDVSVIIPTFLRRAHLCRALDGLLHNAPEAEVIVACDDEMYGIIYGNGKWVSLPWDIGLTAKRNAAVAASTRKYILCGCDDFDFTPEAVAGIQTLTEVLDAHPAVDIAVGRVDNKRYEGFLQWKPGEYIRETYLTPGAAPEGGWFVPIALKPHIMWKIDIGINYFLARREVLEQYPWDENIRPIGGEHGDFFLTLKHADKYVVWVPGVNINTIKLPVEMEDPQYAQYRRRAFATGHRIFLDKWQVKRYISFTEKP
jgi:glycosyltransferase involved in cell wall biosynthesis